MKKNAHTKKITYRNVHHMLKHIVFSQKKAARNEKCMKIAEKERRKTKISKSIKPQIALS
jgi:tRNA G10  N-methylase Trm11